MNTFNYALQNPTKLIDPSGLNSIYQDVDTVYGWEANFILGGGVTYVTCQDDCTEYTLKFVKICIGASAGITGSLGTVVGLDQCDPSTYEGLFLELGAAAAGFFGGFLDIGDGVYEGGLALGIGFQISGCYYIYIGKNYYINITFICL